MDSESVFSMFYSSTFVYCLWGILSGVHSTNALAQSRLLHGEHFGGEQESKPRPSLSRLCAVGSALERSPVMRVAGVRYPVEAWNFRIMYVNAHAQYGS